MILILNAGNKCEFHHGKGDISYIKLMLDSF